MEEEIHLGVERISERELLEGGGQMSNMEGVNKGMRSVPLEFVYWGWLPVLICKRRGEAMR